jgi:dolichyl-phosphate-mannose-protein mannosyltransferase
MSRLRKLQLSLAVVAVVAASVAVWDLVMGGFYYRVLGIRVSSWEAHKPFRVSMLAAVATLQLNDWLSPPADASWNMIAGWSRRIVVATAMASTVVAIHYGIFAAGGADAYGYVSQAALWAGGHLSAPDPLASVASLVGPAAGPLGYHISRTTGLLVPSYPAGLPITMAIAMKLGGPSAVYFVVPLFGGLAVWLTYVLGERIANARAGFVAALLLACSPIFVFQSLEPMSDVPVTAWWLLAWVLALSEGRGAAFAAGLSVSAAVLTRPNLVPLAVVLAAVTALTAPRWQRGTLFVAGMLPGCLAVAALNAFWYGSALRSGYGTIGDLYLWSRASPNLRQYMSWLIELETGVILLAVAAPFVARAKPAATAMLVFFFSLLGCYLFYFVYDTWPFLRFLLPGIPLLLVLASTVMVAIFERLPLRFRGTMMFLICTLTPVTYLVTADRLHVFNIQTAEHRYVAVGEHVATTLPSNAIVLTVIQSGSVRLYGRRPTLRWDLLPPDRLDQTLDGLRSAGYTPYLLLESWEDDLFRERFAKTSAVGNLDWPSTLEYYGPVSVRVLCPGDRHASLRGGRLLPRAVPYP